MPALPPALRALAHEAMGHQGRAHLLAELGAAAATWKLVVLVGRATHVP